MAKRKEKLDPIKELTAKILDSIPADEMHFRQLKMFDIMKHPFFIKPPQSVECSYKFGWIRGMALMTDTMISGKWHSWLLANAKGECEVDDIPLTNIHTSQAPTSLCGKMLEKCMEIVSRQGYRVTDFIEWIGYALGIAWFEKPRLPESIWEELYKTFNLDLFFMEPSDYLSNFVSVHGQSGHLDYYPTPMHITSMINKILNIDNANRTDSQFEPCIGGAAMLLPSESLNLVGADLSLTMVKVASIQAFLYKPWMLYVPRPLVGLHADKESLTINKYFEFDTETRIYWGNSLIGEYQAPKHIFKEGCELIDIFCHPLDLTKRDVFKYEEDMLQDWSSLSDETRMNIVKAQAREIGWNIVTTNPPFNAKMGKTETEKIMLLENSNKIFLEKRAIRMAQWQTSHNLLNKIVYEVELRITEQKGKKVTDGQLELVF